MREPQNFRETLAALKEHFGKDAINAKELAAYLGQSAPTIREAIRQGEIPGRKVGNTYIITLIQLAQWEVS